MAEETNKMGGYHKLSLYYCTDNYGYIHSRQKPTRYPCQASVSFLYNFTKKEEKKKKTQPNQLQERVHISLMWPVSHGFTGRSKKDPLSLSLQRVSKIMSYDQLRLWKKKKKGSKQLIKTMWYNTYYSARTLRTSRTYIHMVVFILLLDKPKWAGSEMRYATPVAKPSPGKELISFVVHFQRIYWQSFSTI